MSTWTINVKEIYMEQITVRANSLAEAISKAKDELFNSDGGGELGYLETLDEDTWSAYNHDTREYFDELQDTEEVDDGMPTENRE